MKKIVWGLVVLLAILHQDFWNWDRIEPLVFGFIPIGLAYHASISLVAAFLWGLAAVYCWPHELEVSDADAAAARRQRGEL